MKKLSFNLELVFLFVCEILIGIVLLINPIGFANLSIQIFGIALIISNIFSSYGYVPVQISSLTIIFYIFLY